MAASGLNGNHKDHSHVVAVAKFAIELLALIKYINLHSFNKFDLRIGKKKFFLINNFIKKIRN